LNDSYETDLDINWFYDGLEPSSFVYRLWANTTDGSDEYFEGNITWNINATANYRPVGNIISPIDDIIFTLPFNITFFIADPNDDNLNASLFLYQNGQLNKTLVTGMNQSNSSYYFDQSIQDGLYELVLKICELNTIDLFCINDTHKIYIDTTKPNVTYLAPIQNLTFNFSQVIELAANVSDNIKIDKVIANITLPTGGNDQVVLNNVSANKYNVSYVVPGMVGTYNITFIANDTAGNVNDSEKTWFVTIGPREAPLIEYISPIPSFVNPTEATYTRVSFNVEVFDIDGVGNINDTGILVNFTKNGKIRQTACEHQTDINITNANYTCNVDMWYWDEPGDWNVSIIAYDYDGNYTMNNSFTSFQYNQLVSIVLSPQTLTWSIASGSVNKLANNDPVIINNTGNANLTLEINATDLYGENNTNKAIFAGNMSVSTNTGGSPSAECFDVILSAGKFVNITNSVLSPGNNSAGQGQEELYYCIKQVGFVSWQNYSTKQKGPWTIRVIVMLAALVIRRRRKSKINKSTKLSVPSTIFSHDLGILESLVKYMKENLSLGYNEIAELLNRDDRTIWTVYDKACTKQRSEIIFEKTLIYLPIEIFQDRTLTPLESIIIHLKERGMRYKDIANILNRDQRNIWITYAKSIKKTEKIIIETKEEQPSELSIIATIFSHKLGVLESLVKYMKENIGLSYIEISKLLNRDQRTIWTVYNKASKKLKQKIDAKKTLVYLPVEIFRNRKLTAFESIVVYLKKSGMRYSEIAKLLDRDQRNIWMAYSKSVKKSA
jgi:DNA-binding CsgD family transcriptional regulator